MNNKHKSLKLKKVIKRMEYLEDGTRRLWIDEILHKFGEDFGSWKYKEGLEQGRLEGFIERDLVEVPPFVDDWIKYCKSNKITLLGALDPIDKFGCSIADSFKGNVNLCVSWAKRNSNTFSSAWVLGYTVMKEKRYLVKMKGMQKDCVALKKNKDGGYWYLSDTYPYGSTVNFHTRKELEEAGFGEVFDSQLFEVKEVEEC